MATLYSLETSANVKLYAAELGRAIQAGRTMPGTTFSLRDAADELGVGWVNLRRQLQWLERDGLLAVSPTGTATVAPLSSGEVRAICRLLHAITPTLYAAACARTSTPTARRLHRQAAEIDTLPIESRHEAMTAFFLALARPTATNVEREQLRLLYTGIERYHHIGITDMIRRGDDEFTTFRTNRQQLNDAVARQDADRTHQVSERVAQAFERFAAHSLSIAASDSPRTRAFSGDRPILRLV